MTDNPRDTSVLIRTNAWRISRGLPRVLVGLAIPCSLLAIILRPVDIFVALGFAAAAIAWACGLVLIRQLNALTEISKIGIHKGSELIDIGFRTWRECETIHTIWFRPYWYMGRNLLWSVLSAAYVPDPKLLDDNNVQLSFAAMVQFAPANHPLLVKLQADPRVQTVTRAAD
ncbi:MAG TPA: hypothetical protein VGN12_19165 [Pirellulales bacterium]|jgi:hypothetical protein